MSTMHDPLSEDDQAAAHRHVAASAEVNSPTDHEPIRVAFVDDNQHMLDAMKHVVRVHEGLEWAGSLDRADGVVKLAQRECPDVVVMDIAMPGADPFTEIRRLQKACPHVRVIMFSSSLTADLVDQAFRSGAWAYVTKSEPCTRLLDTIHRVAQGEKIWRPETRCN